MTAINIDPTTTESETANGTAKTSTTTTEKTTASKQGQGKPESELRAAARRKGLTLKQLAPLMGLSYGYLSQVSTGTRPWTDSLREKAQAVLGEVPGQGVVYRQASPIEGESSYSRERAREVGLALGELADRVGVSRGYMSEVARGKRNLGPALQVQVEAELGAPVKVEAASCPTVDQQALWERMDAHGYSQNQVARLAGISTGHLSLIMNGQRTPSGDVLRRLHEVLFRPTAAELVMPAEVKVLGWQKDGRQGVVVRGAGGPGKGGNDHGGGTVRVGGRVPEGAEVEYAYRTGYDSRGRVFVDRVVDERGYGVMLKKPETGGAGPAEDRTGV